MTTPNQVAIAAGLAFLQDQLRGCQGALKGLRDALRDNPAAGEVARAVARRDIRNLERVERYIFHALSTLPDDDAARFAALEDHARWLLSLAEAGEAAMRIGGFADHDA